MFFFSHDKENEIIDTFRNTNFPSISVRNRECLN